MIARLKILGILLRGYFATKSTISRLPLRVGFFDIDVYRHLTNSRYLIWMDLGRWDHASRSGLARTYFDQKVLPVVANIRITYRKELPFWKKATVVTQLMSIKGKVMHFEQRFESGERLHARAEVDVLMTKNGKVITPPDPFHAFITVPPENTE